MANRMAISFSCLSMYLYQWHERFNFYKKKRPRKGLFFFISKVCERECAISPSWIGQLQKWRTVDCVLKYVLLEVAYPRWTRSHGGTAFATLRFSHASISLNPSISTPSEVCRRSTRISTFWFCVAHTPSFFIHSFETISFQFLFGTLDFVRTQRFEHPKDGFAWTYAYLVRNNKRSD